MSALRLSPFILEDFDAPAPVSVVVPEPLEAEPEIERFSREERDLACALAREEGEATERLRSDERFSAFHQSLEGQWLGTLEGVRNGLDEAAREVAEACAVALLAQVARVFPALLATFGPAERERLFERLLPRLRSCLSLKIVLPAGERARVEAFCARHDLSGIVWEESEALLPGDFRAQWPDGHAAREAGPVVSAVTDEITSMLERITTRRGETA